MPLVDRLGGKLPRAPVTVELDDIQATVLRCRPELLPESPQMGIHRPRLHFRVVAPDDFQNLSAA